MINMDIDDSKYLLQLARAGGVRLPPGPGDWSVHVKPPTSNRDTPENGEQFMYFTQHSQLAQPPTQSAVHETGPPQQQPTPPWTSPSSYPANAARGPPTPQHYSGPAPPSPAHHLPPQAGGSPHTRVNHQHAHHATHSYSRPGNRPHHSDDVPPNSQAMAARQEEARRRRAAGGMPVSPSSMNGSPREPMGYSPNSRAATARPPPNERTEEPSRRPVRATRQPESWEWYYYGEVPLNSR
ncbi:hypothetical protein SAPIO_CDS0385 [Scedosporium apiospermum]|uniref:Uncharacterized protein n=1 Tax=Pseudallescheria apiosperma TaxID=563466 RepID=A0A084GGW8_PSEDA|nr:uncharacterized protein SAPIO_CDS0385 [Scedosporium apiospermum]KEZ46580.1 hypothetical protein SAPIO_CDS0385 [Scedosporium apiospermum]